MWEAGLNVGADDRVESFEWAYDTINRYWIEWATVAQTTPSKYEKPTSQPAN